MSNSRDNGGAWIREIVDTEESRDRVLKVVEARRAREREAPERPIWRREPAKKEKSGGRAEVPSRDLVALARQGRCL